MGLFPLLINLYAFLNLQQTYLLYESTFRRLIFFSYISIIFSIYNQCIETQIIQVKHNFTQFQYLEQPLTEVQMSDPFFSAYQQILKQFYRKSIRTHPNRHQLHAKYLKKAPLKMQSIMITQQTVSAAKNNALSHSRSHIDLKTLQIPPSARSRKGSQKDIQAQSAKLPKKYSDQKSSISQDSEISKDRKRNREQEKYFSCQWIYKTNDFKKVTCFAIIFMYFQGNEVYSFTKLKDHIQTFFQQNFNIDSQIKKGISEWTKMDQTFQKKDRVRWSKILPEIFINLPMGFINLIFEGLTRLKVSQQNLISPTKYTCELISRNTKISLNYFQIFHQEIQKSFDKNGSSKTEINVGYIRQQDNFVFCNKFPQKSEQQIKKQKAIKNISQSIANLLKEYDANTEKLMSLDILSESSSQKQANEKGHLSTKDTFR